MAASGRRVSEIAVGAGLVGPAVLAIVLAAGVAGLRANVAVPVLGALGTAALAAHLGASLLRAWRGRARVPALALTAGALLVAPGVVMAGAPALEALWTLASVALPLHVALQVHRVGAVLARGQRAPPVGAAALLAAAGVVAMLAGPRAPLLWRGFLELGVALPLVAALALGAVALAATAVPAALPTLAYVVAGAAWVTPLALGDVIDPRTASLHAFAVGHGAQIVWLALFVEARAANARADERARTFDGLAHVGLALVLGVVLLVDLPWLASRAAGVDVVTALLVAHGALAVALALIDALAFRLRDPDVAAAIAADARPAPSGRARVSNARALVFMVPGALLAMGLAVDALQTWLTRDDAAPRDLLRAELLHPFDARVLVPRALDALARDDTDEARAALGDVAAARAFSPAAARVRFLLCAHESLRADEHPLPACGTLAAWLDDDVAVLAMRARLALAEGRVDEAKRAATRASSLAPDDARALAALGLVEARLGEPPARDRLLRVLALWRAPSGAPGAVPDAVAEPRFVDPLVADPGLLDVGLALAAAHAARGEHVEAARVTARVVEGAQHAQRPRTALRAFALQGRALEESGDARAALGAYKNALDIASFAPLPAEEARVWLDVGSLLERSQAGEEAVYACALRAFAAARQLAPAHPERAALVERATRRTQETELATAEEAQLRVRSDVDAAARAALTLGYPPG